MTDVPEEERLEDSAQETGNVPASELVDELLADVEEDVAWSVFDFNLAARKRPEAFVSHVPTLVNALVDDSIELHPKAGRGLRALADRRPDPFARHTDQLIGALYRETGPADQIAAEMLSELVQEKVIEDEVREESKQLLCEDSHRLQKRGGRIAGILANKFPGDEGIVDLLTDRLNRYQPVDLCAVIGQALRSVRHMDVEVADALVSKEKVGVLVDYSRWDTESRPMEVSDPHVSFEGSQAALDSRIAPIDELLERDPVDGINTTSGDLLDLVAERHPELLLLHLEALILNMGEEGDSMRYVRDKGRTVLSTLLEERPDELASAIDESAVVLREMLDHDDMASRQCAVRLLARGSSPTARQALDEIAAEPDHTLWTHLQSVSKEPGVEWEFGADREETGRLSMLSDTASSLHVPSPTELARARAQQESRERDIAQQTSVHWKYIRKLEAGNVNPPLAKLAEIWATVADTPDAFESFPTGGRVRNLRESDGRSVNALATESGVDESRLRQFEAEDGDLTCHEVESVLQSMSIESTAPTYPDRPSIHGTWVAFLEALTEALEEVPERSVARDFDETEGDEYRTDRDATAEFGIPEELVPTEEFGLAFNRYNDLLDALDIETEYRVGGAPLRRDLISALREADDAVEGVATGADFQRETEYTTYNLSKEFGGIRAAREAAGTDRDSQSESASERNTGSTSRASAKPERTREQLDEALVDLAESVDRTPTTTQMNEQGAFPTSAYYAEFDTWNEALEAAGLTPRRSARSTGPTREELVEEIQRLADDIGRAPKTTELKSKSDVSLNRYYSEYDSWDDALDDAGLLDDSSADAEDTVDDGEPSREEDSGGLIDDILTYLDGS
jgi:transcriptional regulator with XRE-family HTH domain